MGGFRNVQGGSRLPAMDAVVDVYEHAVLAVRPRARYVVGHDARFLWLPIQALPEWLGDSVLRAVFNNHSSAIPAAAKKRQ